MGRRRKTINLVWGRHSVDVFDRKRIDRSAHACRGFPDGSDGGGELGEGAAELIEFALFGDADAAGAAHRGVRCEDVRPGLLVTNYQGRVVTAYAVDAESVSIVDLSTMVGILRLSCTPTPMISHVAQDRVLPSQSGARRMRLKPRCRSVIYKEECVCRCRGSGESWGPWQEIYAAVSPPWITHGLSRGSG